MFWVILDRLLWWGVFMVGVEHLQMKVGQDGAHIHFGHVT